MLDQHACVMNQHVRVPLLNLLSIPSVIVFEHRARAMEAEVLIKEPLHARQIFASPRSRRQLFIIVNANISLCYLFIIANS